MADTLYLKQMECGPMQNYVYLIGDPATRQAAVVDPAWDVERIVQTAQQDGYTITNIEWSDKVGATKVTITKDGQTATLSFNEALLKQSVATSLPQIPQQPQPIVPPPTAVVPQQPNYQQQNIQQQRPAPIPQLPTPPPRVRGVIPKNPTAVATPYPGSTATPTPEVEL